MKKNFLFAAGLFLACSLSAGGESYFKKNERWLLTGDSITFTDTYRAAVKRIVDHFHPDNNIVFVNRAVWGVDAAHKTKVEEKPTMVSIMLGMNNIIHEITKQFDIDPEKIDSINVTKNNYIRKLQIEFSK